MFNAINFLTSYDAINQVRGEQSRKKCKHGSMIHDQKLQQQLRPISPFSQCTMWLSMHDFQHGKLKCSVGMLVRNIPELGRKYFQNEIRFFLTSIKKYSNWSQLTRYMCEVTQWFYHFLKWLNQKFLSLVSRFLFNKVINWIQKCLITL